MTPAALVLVLAASPPPAEAAPELGALAARVERAEAAFLVELEDLTALDVVGASRRLADELRAVEREAWLLRASPGPVRDAEVARVVLVRVGQARRRLREYGEGQRGALGLSRLLADMRAATAAGRPAEALALHDTRVGDVDPPRGGPILLRRLMGALSRERERARESLGTGERERARPR